MWKRLFETTKQAATATADACAAAPKPAAASAPQPAIPSASKPAKRNSATPAAAAPPKLSTLKKHHSSSRPPDTVTRATSVSEASLLRLKQAAASKRTTLPSFLPHAHAQDEEDPPHALTKALMSVLDVRCSEPDDMEESRSSEVSAEDSEDAESVVENKILDIEWFASSQLKDPLMHWRREVSREKKKQYIFKNTESRRFTKLMQICAKKLGAESTLEFFGKLGRDTGVKEFNALIRACLSKARDCKSTDGDISSLIFYYAANIPNMTVEDIVIAFHEWHEKFEVLPSIAAYDKIISICCNALQTRLALDVADRMCKSNSDVPIESFHPIIHACEQRCELDMFEGAYSILTDAEESREISTTSLYNAIMLGYYREKNHNGAQMVMAQMHIAGVKPDSETFSYLIMNCESEENISKEHIQTEGQLDIMYQLLEELIDSSSWFEGGSRALLYCVQNNYLEAAIDLLKQLKEKDETSTYMVIDKTRLALDVADRMCKSNSDVPIESFHPIIHACEQRCELDMFEGAYSILTDAEESREISTTSLYNAIMLGYYREEHIQTEGQLDIMYQLLEELIDSSSWFEGGSRALLYCVQNNCVQNNYLEAAIDLLKQLKEKDETSTYMVIDKVFGQIWDVEPTKLDLGMKLLHAIKDLRLNISRTSLDFLLSACVKAKDSQQAQKIWTEYESAGLPHNVLTSLRMYQALFSSGSRKAAKKLLKTIPKEDAHVRYIIESCHIQYYSKDFKLSAAFRSSSETKC
ncbi:hypothetical protein PR202_gb06134 [Eleusine coracana subsp. coracana]|uniref:Pentacotripeptide-repeat region of PRORP domain-containing protein n=1 Tax=Eleusine coracana subsp. coracana TaxID=191504 RepID=A0AAV5E8N0_ELECO|nr:hypothetical protein PR202_gb06134 [Eleusine coracana subsp. coracana]